MVTPLQSVTQLGTVVASDGGVLASFTNHAVTNNVLHVQHQSLHSQTQHHASGTAPLTVSFTDQSTGSITSHSWTFGDGGTSNALRIHPTNTPLLVPIP